MFNENEELLHRVAGLRGVMDLGTPALEEQVGEEPVKDQRGTDSTVKGPGEWAFTEAKEVASVKKETSPGSKAAVRSCKLGTSLCSLDLTSPSRTFIWQNESSFSGKTAL